MCVLFFLHRCFFFSHPKHMLTEKTSFAHAQVAKGRIQIEQDGGYIEVAEDGSSTKLEKAAISLSDCLACRCE